MIISNDTPTYNGKNILQRILWYVNNTLPFNAGNTTEKDKHLNVSRTNLSSTSVYKGIEVQNMVKWVEYNGLAKFNELLLLQYGKKIELQHEKHDDTSSVGSEGRNTSQNIVIDVGVKIGDEPTRPKLQLQRPKEDEKEIRQKVIIFYTVVNESKLSKQNTSDLEAVISFALEHGVIALDKKLKVCYGKTLAEACSEFY
eukprot:snap_masked-scaffold_12-processed-gene-6.19-mRNA-1 protein AED:1.00 eAED:1.00 QI:0/0/0/0/1/1/3/0/198